MALRNSRRSIVKQQAQFRSSAHRAAPKMVYVILFALFALIYSLNNYLFTYWMQHGFQQLQPTFLVGDAAPLITMKSCFGEFMQGLYDKFKDRDAAIGIYMFYRPVLVVNDPKLAQDILIRSFSSFHSRPLPYHEKDQLSENLMNLPGPLWRDLRVRLSPAFASGKLKGMFPVISDCARVLEDFLIKSVTNGIDVFEARDLMSRFTTNVISSIAFGIDNDCINQPDHVFRKTGMKFFDLTFKDGIRGLLTFLAPKMFHKLGMRFVDREVEDFIFAYVKQTVEHREENNFSRKDFLQLLIQLRNQGYESVDKEDNDSCADSEARTKRLSMAQLTANVYIFYLAGEFTHKSLDKL